MSNLVTLVALYRRDDFDIYKSLFVSKEQVVVVDNEAELGVLIEKKLSQ